MLKEPLTIAVDNLVGEIGGIKVAGYRLVTLSCTALDENHFDILYHFDRALELKHLRLKVARDTEVPSISPIYFAAFVVENEIQDLFGIRFKGLVIDYERTLYLDEAPRVTPFCKYTVSAPQSETVQLPPESGSLRTGEDV